MPTDRTIPVIAEIQRELAALANPRDAVFLQGYFKTGPGQYGEGDLFRGIRVPVLRKLSGKYRVISLAAVDRLLRSAHHEDRLLALLIMISRYERSDDAGRSAIYAMYLGRTRYINNWDLVDVSAKHVIGAYLEHRSRRPLYKLARSTMVWERRIAVLATFRFIPRDDLDDALKIAALLLTDKEDLIHKAVGWMLREVGKRDPKRLEAFLAKHCRNMPRTMLRYAIERMPEKRRIMYLKGEI